MTAKARIKAKILQKLVRNEARKLDWAGVLAAIEAADTQTRLRIIEALKKGSLTKIGYFVQNLVHAKVKADASAVADSYLADNTLSLDEVDKLL